MSLETLHCSAVAAATIITEHKKKRCRKHWMASFLERRNQNLNILGAVLREPNPLYALSWKAQQTDPRHSGTQAT
jgi:hypothetical protein